jgi:hypothetical protein
MVSTYQPLFPDAFLAARWGDQFAGFRGSETEKVLLERLRTWASKRTQKETAAEGAFVSVFFKQTWGYSASGEASPGIGYTCESQYAVPESGQGGGTGAADLVLGWFDRQGVPGTPQVICEFKGVRAALDKPQHRKGNDRSPIKQCADYLREAAARLYGNEPIQPMWGIVSDMNEFRLYWRKKMPAQYQRFLIKATVGSDEDDLLGDTAAASFQRFLFLRMLHRDMLLSTGGSCELERLLTENWARERAIENHFYTEYKDYREEVFRTLVDVNPSFQSRRGLLVRLTQRFLDRCIFVLFCEDMGAALNFPHNILRDVLAALSGDRDYDPEDNVAWTRVKKLFVAMRDGSPFRDQKINRFNGGLFAQEPELESLHIPTRLFCARAQAASAASVEQHPKTLLYFSATYNFGVKSGSLERGIDLYTLGRIFEQSITELEFLEAKAEGRPSLTELSKRKRDGVYYTPEWVTHFLVEETVGARLAELRQHLNIDPLTRFSEDDIARYRRARASGRRDKRFHTDNVNSYLAALDHYSGELDDLKVVDPACGSGAFLIQSLDKLVGERRWVASERERLSGTYSLFDTDTTTKAVLSRNIYGVDINEESVEITRLALWLHTALPDRPLTSLDTNIRCGNSLIGPEFYTFDRAQNLSAGDRERINAFDWRTAFPEVFNRAGDKAGFDCVIGNPPYVKLQNFRHVMPVVAEYLVEGRNDSGEPRFESTQVGNFDMYLPFIEHSVKLLNEHGRMGFIAPNLWLISEYGSGLRQWLLANHQLDRWLDFRDFPVFEEVMTYTALQFFRGRASSAIACTFSPDGDVAGAAFADASVEYSSLANDGPWVFLPAREEALLQRLSREADTLGSVSAQIFVGVQTSADHIFHMDRISPGRYLPKRKAASEVALEDDIMIPLLSGNAHRYEAPSSDQFILFPYGGEEGRPRLYTAAEMAKTFPKAWHYLREHEVELRGREKSSFDDEQWYRFGRNQNIDKQRRKKLGVAQLVPEMRVFYDEKGEYCLNNVRVNGILVADDLEALFLMAVLNSRVVDFVFRRKAKPKEPRPSGAYFEANKQYIAPLPVPRVNAEERAAVASLGVKLRDLHTERYRLISDIDRRLDSSQFVSAPRPEKWLWADVGDTAYWKQTHTGGLRGKELTRWAKEALDRRVSDRLTQIDAVLRFGEPLAAIERDGELQFFVGESCVISGVFVSGSEAPLILAQWRQKARDKFVSDAMNARRIMSMLLDLKATENAALIEQLRALNVRLDALEQAIVDGEFALHRLLYNLFKLSDEERLMVEADTQRRWSARMPRPMFT